MRTPCIFARSGRPFSPWIAPVSTSSSFSIADAVRAAELNSSEDEDLSQLDSGPPRLNNLPSHSAWSDEPNPTILTTSTCKKRPKKKKTAPEQDLCDILFGDRPRHPRHYASAAPSIQARFELRKIRIAATGWVGLRDTGTAPEETAARAQERGESPTHRLPDFFGPKAIFHGFHLVGYAASGSRPIIDSIGTVCGVFGDRPPDADFMEKIHDPAVEAMEEAWTNLTAGDSMGGGQVCPGALVNGVINTAVLVALLSNIAFIRYAGFATGLLATWAPNLFDFYVDYMRVFYKHYPHLHRPFLNGIWCAVTFNLGPWTCALGHRDYANLAFGWCAITALSHFDYRKGGISSYGTANSSLSFPLAPPSQYRVRQSFTPTSPSQTTNAATPSHNTLLAASFVLHNPKKALKSILFDLEVQQLDVWLAPNTGTGTRTPSPRKLESAWQCYFLGNYYETLHYTHTLVF
ncbi:hypothetical protein B0H17DRAFT_1216496 [Mycena rosella]|uniref:Uncharacterized protein n=1 Tax=Mycena rosella TaxID=1033263 RepID=A0AAD7C710_MYCRO|nr:hypothetical protein B0H17DRAFT_1216496 [Mycena rosella]